MLERPEVPSRRDVDNTICALVGLNRLALPVTFVFRNEWEKIGGKMELTNCYDCKKSISFTATQCLHCGSTELLGPYQASNREKGAHRIEARNDNTAIITCFVSAFLGISLSYLASPP
jgi:hypothetical protein